MARVPHDDQDGDDDVFGSFDGDDDADGDDDVPVDEELPHLAGAGLPVDIVAALHKRER